MSDESPVINANTYAGPERRSGKERRSGPDRREMVRFELEKDPRRSGKDRRMKVEDLWDRRDF